MLVPLVLLVESFLGVVGFVLPVEVLSFFMPPVALVEVPVAGPLLLLVPIPDLPELLEAGEELDLPLLDLAEEEVCWLPPREPPLLDLSSACTLTAANPRATTRAGTNRLFQRAFMVISKVRRLKGLVVLTALFPRYPFNCPWQRFRTQSGEIFVSLRTIHENSGDLGQNNHIRMSVMGPESFPHINAKRIRRSQLR